MTPLAIVFGSSRTKEARHLQAAEELGHRLVQAGYQVGSGGYTAIMDAVSKGAYEAGGHVIAYTTDEFPDAPVTRWCHEERRTPDLHIRIQRMLTEGDAFIAMWGGIGTVAEIAMTWNMGQFSMERTQRAKPFILLGDNWPDFLKCLKATTEIGSKLLRYPTLVATPEEAVSVLEQGRA